MPTPNPDRADQTRQQLLDAATATFAQQGFHAVSLRTVADRAKVNPALIAYHFGNKEGLYLAVFERIVATMQGRMGARADAVRALLAAPWPAAPEALAARRQQLLQVLFGLVDGLMDTMSGRDSEAWAMLISREQLAPTAAFEIIFQGFLRPMHELFTRLVMLLRPHLPEPDARLQVFTFVGQVMVFRLARTALMRQLQWTEFGPDELAAAKAQVHRNLTLLLSEDTP